MGRKNKRQSNRKKNTVSHNSFSKETVSVDNDSVNEDSNVTSKSKTVIENELSLQNSSSLIEKSSAEFSIEEQSSGVIRVENFIPFDKNGNSSENSPCSATHTEQQTVQMSNLIEKTFVQQNCKLTLETDLAEKDGFCQTKVEVSTNNDKQDFTKNKISFSPAVANLLIKKNPKADNEEEILIDSVEKSFAFLCEKDINEPSLIKEGFLSKDEDKNSGDLAESKFESDTINVDSTMNEADSCDNDSFIESKINLQEQLLSQTDMALKEKSFAYDSADKINKVTEICFPSDKHIESVCSVSTTEDKAIDIPNFVEGIFIQENSTTIEEINLSENNCCLETENKMSAITSSRDKENGFVRQCEKDIKVSLLAEENELAHTSDISFVAHRSMDSSSMTDLIIEKCSQNEREIINTIEKDLSHSEKDFVVLSDEVYLPESFLSPQNENKVPIHTAEQNYESLYEENAVFSSTEDISPSEMNLIIQNVNKVCGDTISEIDSLTSNELEFSDFDLEGVTPIFKKGDNPDLYKCYYITDNSHPASKISNTTKYYVVERDSVKICQIPVISLKRPNYDEASSYTEDSEQVFTPRNSSTPVDQAENIQLQQCNIKSERQVSMWKNLFMFIFGIQCFIVLCPCVLIYFLYSLVRK